MMATAILEDYELYFMEIRYKNVSHAVEMIEYYKRKLNHENKYKYKPEVIMVDKIMPEKDKLKVLVYIKDHYHYGERSIITKYMHPKWKTAQLFMNKVQFELDSEFSSTW